MNNYQVYKGVIEVFDSKENFTSWLNAPDDGFDEKVFIKHIDGKKDLEKKDLDVLKEIMRLKIIKTVTNVFVIKENIQSWYESPHFFFDGFSPKEYFESASDEKELIARMKSIIDCLLTIKDQN